MRGPPNFFCVQNQYSQSATVTELTVAKIRKYILHIYHCQTFKQYDAIDIKNISIKCNIVRYLLLVY